jgi:hypothetical protein
MGAVSIDVTPKSYEPFMASIASFLSVFPHIQPPAAHAPNVMAETHKLESDNCLYSISKFYIFILSSANAGVEMNIVVKPCKFN